MRFTIMLRSCFSAGLLCWKSGGAAAFSMGIPALSRRQFRTSPHLLQQAKTATSVSRVSEELLTQFSAQITKELEASQLYLAASIWCDKQDLVGMASFMRAESLEERSHAMDLIDFALKRSMDITLQDIKAPQAEWKDVEEIWQAVLDAEQANTESLLQLGDLASDCRDHTLTTFLQPFHLEQIDGEDKLGTIVCKVTEENRTPGLIRQLDYELGQEAAGV